MALTVYSDGACVATGPLATWDAWLAPHPARRCRARVCLHMSEVTQSGRRRPGPTACCKAFVKTSEKLMLNYNNFTNSQHNNNIQSSYSIQNQFTWFSKYLMTWHCTCLCHHRFSLLSFSSTTPLTHPVGFKAK